MATAAERLERRVNSFQLALLRLSAREQRAVVRILASAESEVIRRLVARSERMGGFFTTARLRLILRELEAVLWENGYQPILDRLLRDLSTLSADEAQAFRDALGRMVPDEIFAVRPGIGLGVPPAPTLSEVASGTMILDHPLGQYFRRTGPQSLVAKEIRRYRRIMQAVIQEGLVLGDATEEMVRRIARSGFRASRLHLRTVVDSAVKATAQRARIATMLENVGEDGVIKGFIWDSTLDTNTTPEWCIPRNRKRYDVEFRPVGHGFAWGNGPGAIHPRCRSNAQAWLKSWRELGIDADEITDATKASMSGPVPQEMSYFDWLASQPQSRWAEVFGVRRAQAIADGSLTFEGALAQMGVRRAA